MLEQILNRPMRLTKDKIKQAREEYDDLMEIMWRAGVVIESAERRIGTRHKVWRSFADSVLRQIKEAQHEHK